MTNLIKRWLRPFPPLYAAAHTVRLWMRQLAYAAIRVQPARIMEGEWGLRWNCEPGNALDEQIRSSHGIYHWATRLVTDICDRETIAVDAGANAGYWALPLARHFHQVLAFDPDPEMVKKLRGNLQLNPDIQSRLRVFQAALSNNSGVATLNVRRELEGVLLNTGLSSLAAGDLSIGGATIEVTTLDRETRDLDRPVGFVKIDVEDWEESVLRGGLEMLGRDNPVILWEAAVSLDARLGRDDVRNTFKLLSDLRYEQFAVSTSPPLVSVRTIEDLEDLGRDVDVLSLPPQPMAGVARWIASQGDG